MCVLKFELFTDAFNIDQEIFWKTISRKTKNTKRSVEITWIEEKIRM